MRYLSLQCAELFVGSTSLFEVQFQVKYIHPLSQVSLWRALGGMCFFDDVQAEIGDKIHNLILKLQLAWLLSMVASDPESRGYKCLRCATGYA